MRLRSSALAAGLAIGRLVAYMSMQRSADSGFQVLVVEDSEDIRTLMVILLESEGYKVEAARSAEEALAFIARTPYDLVLSDYALPGRSGAWLLQEASARQLLEPRRGMLITASPNPPVAAEFEVIQKPLDFEAFLAHLREHLRHLRDHAVVRARARVRSNSRL